MGELRNQEKKKGKVGFHSHQALRGSGGRQKEKEEKSELCALRKGMFGIGVLVQT